MGFAATFVFHSNCSFPTLRRVIFDPSRCQPSRAASPLLVSHSEADCPRAGFIHVNAHPITNIAEKTFMLRILLKGLRKDIKLKSSDKRCTQSEILILGYSRQKRRERQRSSSDAGIATREIKPRPLRKTPYLRGKIGTL
jgi:hypothetical protein